jgi:hypothetical protein
MSVELLVELLISMANVAEILVNSLIALIKILNLNNSVRTIGY